MTDKRDDAPKPRGKRSPPQRRRAELSQEVRALYQKYGEGDVPQHLRDLADKIGKAYAAAHPEAEADPAASRKEAPKAQKKRRRATASGGS